MLRLCYKAILLVNQWIYNTFTWRNREDLVKVAIEVFSILFICVLFPDKHCVFTSLGVFLTLLFCLVECCVAFQVGLANSENSSHWGGMAHVLTAVLVWSVGGYIPSVIGIAEAGRVCLFARACLCAGSKNPCVEKVPWQVTRYESTE